YGGLLLLSAAAAFSLYFLFFFFRIPPPPRSTLFPYTTLFRSLPAMDANAKAAWARVRVVPLDVSFEGREDHSLEERLETELAGVRSWAVGGLRQYQQNGLDEPDAVKAPTDAYRSDNDALSRFIDDQCVLNPAASVTTAKITEMYNQRAAVNGEQPISSRALGKELRERDGIHAGRTETARGLIGIGVKANGA